MCECLEHADGSMYLCPVCADIYREAREENERLREQHERWSRWLCNTVDRKEVFKRLHEDIAALEGVVEAARTVKDKSVSMGGLMRVPLFYYNKLCEALVALDRAQEGE